MTFFMNRSNNPIGGIKMYDTTIILKKGEGRVLKSGGMWIYDNEIDKIEGEFTNGDLITVRDFDS